MDDLRHVFEGFPEDDGGIEQPVDPVDKTLNQIDVRGHFASSILTELDETTSPTLAAMWWEARDAYIAAMKALVDLDPFTSDEQKARFLRAQNDARRFKDMVVWLGKYASDYKAWLRVNQDEEVQRIRREREQDARPTE